VGGGGGVGIVGAGVGAGAGAGVGGLVRSTSLARWPPGCGTTIHLLGVGAGVRGEGTGVGNGVGSGVGNGVGATHVTRSGSTRSRPTRASYMVQAAATRSGPQARSVVLIIRRFCSAAPLPIAAASSEMLALSPAHTVSSHRSPAASYRRWQAARSSLSRWCPSARSFALLPAGVRK